MCDGEIPRSAHRHGFDDVAILHALGHVLTVVDLDPDADPPKMLAIGPDPAGNLLEIVWLELAEGAGLVIHDSAVLSTTCFHHPERTPDE